MQNSTSQVLTPSLKRRLICLIYEAFLVAAVAMLGMLAFLLVFQGLLKMNETFIAIGGQVAMHAWMGSGHTLAMKTWRIKIVKVGEAAVPFRTALLRYLLCWGWVLPALAISHFRHFSRGQMALTLAGGLVAWGMTALFDRDRQFLHDRLAGTRLISLPKKIN